MKDVEIFESERASHYDEGIRKWFGGYDLLQQLLFPILNEKAGNKPQARILVLGSGTGNELLRLAPLNPSWNFTGLDPSEAMNLIAREKLSRFSNVRIQDGTIRDTNGTWDAVLCLLVTHFLDEEAKARIYADVFRSLADDGVFIFADIVGNKEGDDSNFDTFNAYLKTVFEPAVAEQGFSHIRNDVNYIPEEDLLGLLKSGGFQKIRPFFQWLMFKAWILEK